MLSRPGSSAGTRPAGTSVVSGPGRARRWPARAAPAHRRDRGDAGRAGALPGPASRPRSSVTRRSRRRRGMPSSCSWASGAWTPTGGSAGLRGPPAGALECLATVGGWQKLRRLDLPAALELAGPGGERRYAVLTALTPSEATLRFGDRVVTAPLSRGGALLGRRLRRPLAASARWRCPVRRGARGPAADWLRRAHGPGRWRRTRRSRAAGRTTTPCGSWSRPSSGARSLEPTASSAARRPCSCSSAERGPDVPRLSAGTP